MLTAFAVAVLFAPRHMRAVCVLVSAAVPAAHTTDPIAALAMVFGAWSVLLCVPHVWPSLGRGARQRRRLARAKRRRLDAVLRCARRQRAAKVLTRT